MLGHGMTVGSIRARVLFALDKELSDYYNGPMIDGKWKIMMLDVHIGYEQWFIPSERARYSNIESVHDRSRGGL